MKTNKAEHKQQQRLCAQLCLRSGSHTMKSLPFTSEESSSLHKSEKYLHQWRDIDRPSYVPLAKIHIEFLESVSKNSSLLQGEHLRNAVRRYELLWLPLCKKHGTMSCEDWSAPLDVAWVWYLHMTTPSYVSDCIQLIGNAPSHALKTGEALQKALFVTKALWEQAYSTVESFDVDLTAPLKSSSYRQKLPHDFKRLSLKQRNFYYQVSLPHYHDDEFLDAATERYVTHLDLQMRNTSVCLSLPVDVQLIMYTHQLNPIFYHYQMNVILGKVNKNYNDYYPLDSKEKIKRKYKAEMKTKELWDKAGEVYHKPGTLYRGDLPHCSDQLKPQRYAVPVKYDISVTKIEVVSKDSFNNYALLFAVSNGNETSKTKIKIERDIAGKIRSHSPLLPGMDEGVEYVQLEELASEHKHKSEAQVNGHSHPCCALFEDESPENNNGCLDDDVFVVGDGKHALMKYKTTVVRTTSVQVLLYEIERSKLNNGKALIGETDLDVFKFLGYEDVEGELCGDAEQEYLPLESAPNECPTVRVVQSELCIDEAKQTVCLPLEFPNGCPTVRLTLSMLPISCGHNVYQVSPEYEISKFKHIYKALSSPTLSLPLSMLAAPEVLTEVMTYPISDYRGRETFSCRVVRSCSDLFFAVEILDKKGRTTATASLLSDNALPNKSDLSSNERCAYVLPDGTQHAMLIRGREDWGICFGQQHQLAPSGRDVFFGLKLFLLHDKTKSYCYVQKFRNSLYMFTLRSTHKILVESHIYLHLTEGKVVMSSNLNEIPEILAFALSALILRYLFCEKNQDCWAMIDGEGMDLLSIFQSNDDVGLLWNGVYEGDEASNETQHAMACQVAC